MAQVTKLHNRQRITDRRRKEKKVVDEAVSLVVAVQTLARMEREASDPAPLLAIMQPDDWQTEAGLAVKPVVDWQGEVGLARAYLNRVGAVFPR